MEFNECFDVSKMQPAVLAEMHGPTAFGFGWIFNFEEETMRDFVLCTKSQFQFA